MARVKKSTGAGRGTLTGLVILASGMWQEKFGTEFDDADTQLLEGAYTDANPPDVDKLYERAGDAD